MNQTVVIHKDSDADINDLFQVIQQPIGPGKTKTPMQNRKLPKSFFNPTATHGHTNLPQGQLAQLQYAHSRAHSSPAQLGPINSPMDVDIAQIVHRRGGSFDILGDNSPVHLVDDSPLPYGWSMARAANGQPYFLNHLEQISTWDDPRKTNPNTAAVPMYRQPINPAEMQVADPFDGLPQGWEKAITEDGTIYYIDHLNKKTTWEPPAECPEFMRWRARRAAEMTVPGAAPVANQITMETGLHAHAHPHPHQHHHAPPAGHPHTGMPMSAHPSAVPSGMPIPTHQAMDTMSGMSMHHPRLSAGPTIHEQAEEGNSVASPAPVPGSVPMATVQVGQNAKFPSQSAQPQAAQQPHTQIPQVQTINERLEQMKIMERTRNERAALERQMMSPNRREELVKSGVLAAVSAAGAGAGIIGQDRKQTSLQNVIHHVTEGSGDSGIVVGRGPISTDSEMREEGARDNATFDNFVSASGTTLTWL